MEQVCSQRDDVICFIRGAGPEGKSLQRQIDRLCLDANAAIGFERGNISSLADELESLILSPDRRMILSHNARKLVHEALSWKKVAEKSIQVYTK